MALLEREEHLGRLTVWLQDARRGEGRLALLAGEAGVGKSALVRHFAEAIDDPVHVGACDPLSTPRPLGPLLDVAHLLGDDLAVALDEPVERGRVFGTLLAVLRAAPAAVVLVFEDVHWADDATLDLLQFLGRRIATVPTLLVATFRDDEVGAGHPLTRVLGHLATAPGVRRLGVERLTEEAVRTLARDGPWDVTELMRLTGGNPFFVTEILELPGRALPATVRDAVLARASRLSPPARRVLEVAAIVGPRIEPWLLDRVAVETGAVDECVALGMLHASGGLLVFRHELARQAVLQALAPQRRRSLHQAALAALRSPVPAHRADALARLAHHAEGAGDAEAVLAFAPAAAESAAQSSAHREAAAQYARALRFAGRLEPQAQAELREARAYQCYLVNDIDGALRERRSALSLRRDTGAGREVGENLRWLSRLSWMKGLRQDAVGYAADAIAALEPEPAGVELAWAYSNRSQLCMLGDDAEGARGWGERAIALARRLASVEVEVHAENNIGASGYVVGREEGLARLERSLQLAYRFDLEEHVARALTNLGSYGVRRRELTRGLAWLDEGVAYTEERDLDSWRLYMLGWRAVALLRLGRWSEACELAAPLLADPLLPAMSRIQPLVVLGLVRARRGDPDADLALDEAWALARATDEMQRLVPVAAARAEFDWVQGSAPRDADALPELLERARVRGDAWSASELAYWCVRHGLEPGPSLDPANPFALEASGRWRDAEAAWNALGCPFEAAVARAGARDEATLRAAAAAFARLGARPMVERVGERLHELGLRGLPNGPRRATLANPAQLTPRQLQVLGLLVEGLTNPQIAARLHRSAKTIDHHVSAVLAKLEVRSRTEAVRKALEEDLLDAAD